MAIDTPLDQIIDYKSKIIRKIKNSQEIMGLVFNDPNIDMEGDEVYYVEKNNLFDYAFDPSTIQGDKCTIFVLAKMADRPNANFYDMSVSVTIICNKGYINLDTKKFKGTKGNRIDNVARQIVAILDTEDDEDEEQEFGIGDLELVECSPATAPQNFTAVELIYEVPDFAGCH